MNKQQFSPQIVVTELDYDSPTPFLPVYYTYNIYASEGNLETKPCTNPSGRSSPTMGHI